MLMGIQLMYSGIECAWWLLAVWTLLRVTSGGNRRWWLGVGAMIGLGMQTRCTMLMWAIGLTAGILATPRRRQLATPWPWLGAALSLLMVVPNAWWQ